MVPPTVVTHGHEAGNDVANCLTPSLVHSPEPPTPLSPLATRIETPRAPSWLKRLHALVAYESGTVCSSSPYEMEIVLGRASLAITWTHSNRQSKYWDAYQTLGGMLLSSAPCGSMKMGGLKPRGIKEALTWV